MINDGFGSSDTQPMHEDELGRYVCVARGTPTGGCLRSPDITITSDGVWVRYPDSLNPGSHVYSSAHRACYQSGECVYMIPCAVLRAAAEGVSGLLGDMLASRTCGCDKELKTAAQQIDSISGPYAAKRLDEAALQARKNRVWDAR